MAQLDELSLVTLSPKFIYTFGDRPYFSSELNRLLKEEGGGGTLSQQQQKGGGGGVLFLKFKVNTDEYVWTRVLHVVEHSEAYTWNHKRFRIKFVVEGQDALVGCQSVSSKPLDQTDVRGYLLRHCSAANRSKRSVLPTKDNVNSNYNGVVGGGGLGEISNSDVAPRLGGDAPMEAGGGNAVNDDDSEANIDYGVLPSVEACSSVKKHLNVNIARRSISDSDVAALEEYATALHAYPGNLAVKHTNTLLANLREETLVGHTTSYHTTGISAKAQTRRLGDRGELSTAAAAAAIGGGLSHHLQEGGLSQVSGSSALMQPTQSMDLFAATQPSPMSPVPASPLTPTFQHSGLLGSDDASSRSLSNPSSLLLSDVSRWTEAKLNEERFRDYIGAPDRSGFVDFLAERTRTNAALNARATVLAMSKGDKQKSNMIESAGLWITDDATRKQTADEYVQAKNEAVGGGGAGEEKKSEEGGVAAPSRVSAQLDGATTAHKRLSSTLIRDELLSALSSQALDDVDSTTPPLSGSAEHPPPHRTNGGIPNSHQILVAGVAPHNQLIFHASVNRKRARD